ncbi:MAG: pyridoxamine 5'-phosphate oxidase family protein, partial [Acidimicrobiia bacterium]|nr:pyridoxamine 5'-phosphate oxidase family protein [Acidimicrobiia bacterium]
MGAQPASERVRVRRVADRGRYDRETIDAILDEALVAHVGVHTERGPIVLPMTFGRSHDTVYLHGAVGNDLLRQAAGHDVCVTVTLLDGLVVARSAFHHSMNYRCVVVRGQARRVDDEAEMALALRLITDRFGQGRYDDCRGANADELRRTTVLAVALDEASAKVRQGGPIDDADDLPLGHWAGVVPMELVRGTPEPAPDLPSGIP